MPVAQVNADVSHSLHGMLIGGGCGDDHDCFYLSSFARLVLSSTT